MLPPLLSQLGVECIIIDYKWLMASCSHVPTHVLVASFGHNYVHVSLHMCMQ